MRTFQYIIGVDAPDEQTAIAEATHRLSLAEHRLAEGGDYDGELPILHDFENIQVSDERGEGGGPDFAVVVTVEALRLIPIRLVTRGEVVRRPDVDGYIDVTGDEETTETIDTPWCPCQEARFEAQYPDVPRSDMIYLDGIDTLEAVHSSHYYERKRNEARDPNDLSRVPKGPKTPRTRRDTKIISENFPDVDYVCPCCEQGYVEETEIREA